jgi:hypothetical protein
MLLLLGGLFLFMFYFVGLSLKGDLRLVLAHPKFGAQWEGGLRSFLAGSFDGSEEAVTKVQDKLSRLAPALAITYGLFYSFFAFEMIVSMDKTFMSNLFGAFMFMGNVYVGWVFLALSAMYHARHNEVYARQLSTSQFWDLGKLSFGFCMVWGYFFFSQFLPIWYGNLPEETQWMILRTREYPWKGLGYVVFGCCFIVPFIVLLSRDVKKSPAAYATVCMTIFTGIWLQDYLLIMPQLSPDRIPLSLYDLGIFLGFLGLYGFMTRWFLGELPFATVSSPVSRGSIDW